MFDNLQHSIISFGQICGDNCEVVLDKNNLYAFKNEKLILQVIEVFQATAYVKFL